MSLFLRQNQYRKRGIYLLTTKFGVGFGVKFLCQVRLSIANCLNCIIDLQAGALVQIYADGSVLVSHGGVEMGQGLHTKMIQVAAACLGVDIDSVHIDDTATDKVPNASTTGASIGSDLFGLAVQVFAVIHVSMTFIIIL